MKGLFIPEITAEEFRNGCLESIEALMAEGAIYDIEYPQPCEDCISRAEALRHRHIIYDDDGIGYSVVRVDEIKSLPPVIPQPKTGEWIYTGDYFTEGMCRCSKCGVEVDPSEARKFCFECGSYNGGGEDAEESKK